MTDFKWPDSAVEKAARAICTKLGASPDDWRGTMRLAGNTAVASRAALDAAIDELLASGMAQRAIGTGNFLMNAYPLGSIMDGPSTFPCVIIRLPE